MSNPLLDCLICHSPLGPPEHNLSRRWHFDCEKCFYCQESLAHCNTRIQLCIDQEIPVSHLSCFDHQKIREIKEERIPFTRSHLQSLNKDMLALRSQKVTDEDVKLLGDLYSDIRELAANVAFALRLTKEKILIDESQAYGDKVKRETRAKRDSEAIDQENKNRLDAERKDPRLREKRKAIEGLMKSFGLSLENATQAVETQFSKSTGGNA